MNPAPPPSKPSTVEWAAVVARWFLGGCFLYMGWIKAAQPAEFLETIRLYKVLASPFPLNWVAALLPWFEMVCGLLLILGVAVRGSALVLIGMLVPFTILVLRRALAMAAENHTAFCAIKFDCGCGNGVVPICSKLVENSGLILLACWLIFARGRRLCLRYQLFKNSKTALATPIQ